MTLTTATALAAVDALRGGGGARTVDVRVLLLAGRDDDPATQAWVTELAQVGVAFDVARPSAEYPLRDVDLVRESDHGRYNAVVMTTDSSTFLASIDVVRQYGRHFAVRLLAGFEYPRSTHGLLEPAGRAVGGEVAQLTADGRVAFPYLRGPIPIEQGSFGYLTVEVDEAVFTPFVALPSGAPLVGVADTGEGLEEMVVTINYAEPMIHWRLLARGLLTWVTRGVHLGLGRNYLSCHVDDIFLGSAEPTDGWDNGKPPASIVRMTADDVHAVVAWQRQNDFVLDLAYNGAGAGTSGEDPLTTALLEHKERFRWLNHTWSHLNLSDPMPSTDATERRWRPVNDIREQVELNRAWAISEGIDASPTALVTGAHSGLDNPNMPTALERSGISAIATDASRELDSDTVGPAIAVPRYPTNISTHVSSWDELLDDYNERYDGEVRPMRTPGDFLAAETQIMLRHMLSNDPRPTFGHQANLTRDRPLLTLIEDVLAQYRRYLSDDAPIVNPTMDEVATERQRRARWSTAIDRDEVSALLVDAELRVTSSVDVDVPVTLPAGAWLRGRWMSRVPFGSSYCSAAMGWHTVQAGRPLRIMLPTSRTLLT